MRHAGGTSNAGYATVWWTLLAFLSHWRRHPGVLAQLFAGLAIATALWSGVQALNQEARESYDRAAHLLSSPGTQSFVAKDGGGIALSLYVALKRAGLPASPVLEGDVRIGGRTVHVVGIEPLSLLQVGGGPKGIAALTGTSAAAFVTPPGVALINPETLHDLGDAEALRVEGALKTASSEALPPVTLSNEVPASVILVDIAVAGRLLNRPDWLTRVIVPASLSGEKVIAAAQGALRSVRTDEESDLERLTGSFHLNLTAFGLLSFIVGLFIVNAAIGLAFEQRLPLVRTVRALGVSARVVTGVLAGELCLLAITAGAFGMIGGYGLAAALMPDVAASLSGLYGAAVPGTLSLRPEWWGLGLLMTVAGTVAAGAGSLFKAHRLPVLQIAQPAAWREAQARLLTRQALLAVLAALGAGLAYAFGQGLVAGFLVIAGAMLAAALLLPSILQALLRFGEAHASRALFKWVLADSRQQLAGLSLALMALLLALTTNIGVGTMVEGFRATFKDWLDRRLFADIYIEAQSDRAAADLRGKLAGRPGVDAVLELARTEARFEGAPLEVLGATDHPRYRANFDVLDGAPVDWERVRRGETVLINEQLARRAGLSLGDEILIPLPSEGSWRAVVAGIYADYGNPKAQVRSEHDVVGAHFPDARRTSLGLLAERDAVPNLISEIEQEGPDRVVRVVDQAELKRISFSIFERTFSVTTALNALTLAVSGIALLSTLLTLSETWLRQMAPLWAMGVTRRTLGLLEVMRVVGLSAATAILAIPLGVFLAWCLVAIVNVRAFGWRLPLHVFPADWALVFALAALTALVAAAWPILRLMRMTPAALLKVFDHDR